MAEYTRPATWEDLKVLVQYLQEAAGHSWEEMQRYVETIEFDGMAHKILNLQGLLLTKQGARPKDQMDAAMLRQALAEIGDKKR